MRQVRVHARRASEWRIAAILFALVAAVQAPASASERNSRLVNENQHRTVQAPSGWTCTGNPPAEENVTPPLSDLGDNTLLGAHSYHVGTTTQFAQARCYYNAYNRPKIISSDIGGVLPTTAQGWMQAIQNNHQLGQVHFEHFEPCMAFWAEEGNPISDLASFPNEEDCDPFFAGSGWPNYPAIVLGWFKNGIGSTEGATRLLQNGLLYRPNPAGPGNPEEKRKLKWLAKQNSVNSFEDSAKRLMGFSFMGGITAGDARLDIDAYLRTLRAHNVNFTREWSLNQWTGLASLQTEGVTPFSSTDFVLNGSSYNLDFDNVDFYNRLRKFVQSAADRGIVVQLTVFDKHGLICNNQVGRYLQSPYREPNNLQDYMAPGCACTGLMGPAEELDSPLDDCRPLDEFIDTQLAIAEVHKRMMYRIGEEVGGIGNVIFEIINEAMAPYGTPPNDHDGDWAPWGSSHPYPNEVWQESVLEQMRLSLPIENTSTANFVVRDAFNGDNETALNGKFSDIQNATWSASGAKVKVSSTENETGSFGPARIMGYATSNGSLSAMSGSLAMGNGVAWTKASVRGDVTCSTGLIDLGLDTTTGMKIWARLDCGDLSMDPPLTPALSLYEKLPSDPFGRQVATTTLPNPTNPHHLKLAVLHEGILNAMQASVYLDGEQLIKTEDISENELDDLGTAWFRGFASCYGQPGCTYLVDAGKVDNFEAARFCEDEEALCEL